MKIKAVRLKEVGMFREPVALEGFSGGLDVLAGANEFGKSTIFRAIEGVFLKKHTVTGKAVEALMPRAGGAPLIEVDFEQDDRVWRITKRFGRSKSADLVDLSDGGSVFRGPDAEDRLAEIIGLNDGGASRFSLLWVAQKHGLGRPGVDIDPVTGKTKDRGERSIVMNAIESEIETIAGGPLAREVRGRVEAALGELVTGAQGKARKGGALQVAQYERDELEERLKDARDRADETAHRMDELGQLRERYDRLSDQGARSEKQTALNEQRFKLERLSKVAQQLKTAVAERDVATERLKGAEQALAVFDGELTELDGLLKQIEKDRSLVESLKEQRKNGEAELRACEKEGARLSEDDKRLVELSLTRASLDKRAQACLRVEERSSSLAAVRVLEEQVREARAALARDPLIQEVMDELTRFEQELTVGEGKLVAVSPTVEISYARGGSGRISIDGTPVGEDRQIVVGHPLELTIKGVGTVNVVPGAGDDRSSQERELEQIRVKVSALLSSVGAADIASARARFGERGVLERSMHEASAQLSALAPQGVEALAAEVDTLKAAMGSAVLSEDVPAVKEIQSSQVEVQARLKTARETYGRLRETLDELVRKVEVAKAQLDQRLVRRRALEEKLGTDAVRPMKRSDLVGAFEKIRGASDGAQRALKVLQEEAPDLDALSALQEKVARDEAEFANSDNELNDLRVRMAALEGQIQAADDAGVGLLVGEIEGELSRAVKRVAHLDGEVAALRLLDEALLQAGTRARDQMMAPVVNRLNPYLSMLFPDARISFGDSMELEGLSRAGIDEGLDVLSDGTLEQLSIVVRLGYARLLAETGVGGPLILDDPLAYCDEARAENIFEALRLGAHTHQVIVFTCRVNAFSNLGGTRLSVTAWSP